MRTRASQTAKRGRSALWSLWNRLNRISIKDIPENGIITTGSSILGSETRILNPDGSISTRTTKYY